MSIRNLVKNINSNGEEVEADSFAIRRLDIKPILLKMSLIEVKDLFLETRMTCLPVCENSLDNIIGYYDVYMLLEGKKIQEAKTVSFIASNTSFDKILDELSKTSLLVIVDEFGGTDGIITHETIINECYVDMNQVSFINGIMTLDARYPMEKLNDILKINSNSETIGGFVLEHLGYLPHVDEKFIYNHYEFHILEVNNRFLKKIRISITH